MPHYSARAQWNTANARKASEPVDYLFGECKCAEPKLDKRGWCSVCNLKRRPTLRAPAEAGGGTASDKKADTERWDAVCGCTGNWRNDYVGKICPGCGQEIRIPTSSVSMADSHPRPGG